MNNLIKIPNEYNYISAFTTFKCGTFGEGELSLLFSSILRITISWSSARFLSSAIRSMIEVKEDKDIDSLFLGGKTTALVDTISGLDDFELITFLVIQ